MNLEVDARTRLGAFQLDARFASDGRVTALFGRSGSGKTSLVRIIAGLLRPDRGRVVVEGRALLDTGRRIRLPPYRRRIGYVFQEPRLFPHLSVRQNLLFGRWLARRAGRDADLEEIVQLLGLGPLLARRPAGLSGGEKSRVAIGRALLSSPRLLLMDEPLANLDEPRRAEILPYLERLRDHARVPIVYVSHSVAEVARLATTVVVLEGGRVVACGPAADVLARSDLGPALRTSEAGSLIEAWVVAADDGHGLTVVDTRAGRIVLPQLGASPGTTLRLRIAARDVIVATERPRGVSALNVLDGRVVAIRDADPASVLVEMECGGERVMARITRRSVEELGLAEGREVHAILKSVALDDRLGASLPS